MNFQTAYMAFLAQHMSEGSPERRRKLRGGLGFAEHAFLAHVWWPAIGNFTHLLPEYEVADYSGASRFLDFAYLRGSVKLAIEVDGFTAHAQNIDRRQFAYRLHRQNLLTLDMWDILRFAYDEIKSHPRRCQRTIQQYMGSRFATDLHNGGATPRCTAIDREIVRLARSLPGPLTPADIKRHLDVSRPTAYRYINRLVSSGMLEPASGTNRIRTYRLTDATRKTGL